MWAAVGGAGGAGAGTGDLGSSGNSGGGNSGGGGGGPTTTNSAALVKELFREEQRASSARTLLPLAQGLILYRVLSQALHDGLVQNMEHAQHYARHFRSLFFEFGDHVASFFTSTWVLDHCAQLYVPASSVQALRDAVHTLHLQGVLRSYFSARQLERLFCVTRGPYVSGRLPL
jgi:hypothetical protein